MKWNCPLNYKVRGGNIDTIAPWKLSTGKRGKVSTKQKHQTDCSFKGTIKARCLLAFTEEGCVSLRLLLEAAAALWKAGDLDFTLTHTHTHTCWAFSYVRAAFWNFCKIYRAVHQASLRQTHTSGFNFLQSARWKQIIYILKWTVSDLCWGARARLLKRHCLVIHNYSEGAGWTEMKENRGQSEWWRGIEGERC